MVEECDQWVMAFISQDYKSSKLFSSISVGLLLVSFLIVLSAALLLSYMTLQQETSELSLQAESKSTTNNNVGGVCSGLLLTTKTKIRSEKLNWRVLLLESQLTPFLYENSQTFSTSQKKSLNFLPEVKDTVVNDDIGAYYDSFSFSQETEFHLSKKREALETAENEPEAKLSLNMALRMKKCGKVEKALKLYQHAMALNLLHPDILTYNGEFNENQDKNVIEADQLYRRAQTVCPEHSRALANRVRTIPVVEGLDQEQLNRIDRKRDQLFQLPDNDPSLKRMKKEAYFEHIHHTVALEGNTMTLAEIRSIVETRMAVPGKSILEHNEIIGLESALKYINNSLVTNLGTITVDDILEIHKRVLGHVDPVEAGTVRQSQVHVNKHVSPPPAEVLDLMEDMIDWLNSDKTLKLHPVKYAALAHYKFVFIHPFMDGNGRTGRLFMNLILMKAGYPPVIVRKQDRSLYYKCIQLANEGDVGPFIRFMGDCTERTLDVYLFATKYGTASFRALEGHDDQIKSGIIES